MFDVAFADRTLWLPSVGALVVADLHVGRAAVPGVTVPLPEREDLTERLSRVVERFDPDRVVVAGDVLHEFGRVTHQARGTLDALAGVCRAADASLTLVAGNHDTMLDTAWDGPVHDSLVLDGDDDVLVCHGHEAPTTDAALYVVGHDHPAISIEGRKRPCFLYGEGAFRGGDVLMLPAFSRVARGAVINGMHGRDFQTPLVSDVDRFRPVVWDESNAEALWFPPLGEFRRML